MQMADISGLFSIRVKKNGHVLTQLFWIYRKNAAKRGIFFDLDRDEFDELVKQDCYICGSPPSNVRHSSKTGVALVYSGIDRVDNTLGYINGNVMPCCKTCNYIKREMSISELKTHLRKMVRGLKGV